MRADEKVRTAVREKMLTGGLADALPPPAERRALRVHAKVSIATLASVLGCTPQAVAYWESGRSTPRDRLLRGYLSALEEFRSAGARHLSPEAYAPGQVTGGAAS